MPFDEDSFSQFGRRRQRGTGATGAVSPLSTVSTTSIAPTEGDGELDDSLQGDGYTPPNGNTGIGGTAGGNNPNPGSPPPVLGPAAGNGTKLYGTLDPGKLANPNGSAKYEFLNAAQGMNRYDPAAILAALKGGANGGRWQGWTAGGDKIRYGGNNLDAVFDGWDEFDTIHDMDNPNGPAGWGWQGTHNRNAPAADTSTSALLAVLAAALSGQNGAAPAATTPTAPPAATAPVSAPPLQPSAGPTFAGVSNPMALSAGGVPKAFQTLAMQMPQLFAGRSMNDPLTQQLLALLGGRT